MSNYKFGIHISPIYNSPAIAIGVALFQGEKYFYIDFLLWELSIGRTSKS